MVTALRAPAVRAEEARDWVEAHARPFRLALVAVYLLVSVPYALTSSYGGDEVYHSYPSVAVLDGQLPYRDFFFPQGPLTLYVYALPQAVFGPGMEVVRLTTVALGLGALLLSMKSARRLAGPLAGVLCGATVVASVQYLTYAGLFNSPVLVAFLLAGSVAALTARWRPWVRFLVAGLLLGATAGVRLSAAVTLPLLVAYALLGERPRGAPALAGAAGAVGGMAACYLPFVLADPAGAHFSLLRFHLLDSQEAAFGFARQAKYRLDGLARLAAFFPAQAGLFAAAVFGFLLAARRAPLDVLRRHLLPVYIAFLAVAVLGVNFLKVYIQPYWPVMVLPLVALVAGVFLARVLPQVEGPRGRDALLLLVAAGLVIHFVAALPTMAALPVPHTDGPLMKEVAVFVEGRTAPGDQVLTLRPFVTVWAHREVVPGTETGKIGYFPSMPPAEAEAVHVLDGERLVALLQDEAPAALVLVDGDFRATSIPAYATTLETFDAVWRAIGDHYEHAAAFGEGPDAVHVYLRKGAVEA